MIQSFADECVLCVSLCTKNANGDYIVFFMQYVIAIVCSNLQQWSQYG